MSKNIKLALLDCDAGRKLGCKSFCCRLLVRLEEHERNEVDPETQRTKGYVDKKENGTCLHQNEQSGLCLNWENRPKVCREYDCNFDKMLQIVLKSSGKRISDWMKESVKVSVIKEEEKFVPYIKI